MNVKLLSLYDLADELDVSLADLRSDILSGDLPAHRVAGQWVLVAHEIRDYLEALDAEDDEEEAEDAEDDACCDDESEDDEVE